MVFRGDALRWRRPLSKRPISNPAIVALAFAGAGNHDVGLGQVDGTAGGRDEAQS